MSPSPAAPMEMTLKACPACGGSAFAEAGDYGDETRVRCSSEDCHFQVYVNGWDTAIRAWNHRATASEAARAAAEAMVEEIRQEYSALVDEGMDVLKRAEAAEAQAARLREALTKISHMQYHDRQTVSPDTAWAAYNRLNSEIIGIFKLADWALALTTPQEDAGHEV